MGWHCVAAAGSQVLFRVKRPAYLISSHMVIEDGAGAQVGEVHQRWALLKRNYDLYLGKRQFAAISGAQRAAAHHGTPACRRARSACEGGPRCLPACLPDWSQQLAGWIAALGSITCLPAATAKLQALARSLRAQHGCSVVRGRLGSTVAASRRMSCSACRDPFRSTKANM